MPRWIILCVVFFSMIVLRAKEVSADVVMPPPTSCPEGTNPTTSHAGPYCEPSVCQNSEGCNNAKVCRSYGLCVLVEDTFCGKGGPCKINKGQGPCQSNADCTQPATCVTALRCVSTSVEVPAEATSEPTAEPAKEASTEPAKEASTEPPKEASAEPSKEPVPDGTTQPENTVEKATEPVANEATPETTPNQEKVVGEGAKDTVADTGKPAGGCGCYGGESQGGMTMLLLFALLGFAISMWRERSLQKKNLKGNF